MGWRFRKRIKIAPGIHMNLGKSGVTSLSIGKKGASVNVGKKGVTGTVGIPGTGLSYTEKLSGPSPRMPASKANSNDAFFLENQDQRALSNENAIKPAKKVGWFFAMGIVFFPYFFAWFTLQEGYDSATRAFAFGWLFFVLFLLSR
jgi:hypothetical protein